MPAKHNSNEQGAMNVKPRLNSSSTSSSAILAIPRTDDGRSLSSGALSDVPSDVIIKTRIRYGSRWSACKGLLMEYSKSTSIHGIRYLFEVHRPIYEKIFWLVTLSTSLYFGFSLSRDMYRKWQDSPVILAFDDTLVPVHQIPFPTITICPQTKIRKSSYDFEAFAKRLVNQFVDAEPEPDYKSEYESEVGSASFENYTYSGSDNETIKFLMAASLHICDNEFALKYAPLLKHAEDPQKIIFNLVATDEGICYQFNGLVQEDIYRNDSFPTMVDKVISFQSYRNFYRSHFTKKKDDLLIKRFHIITGNWSLEDGYVGQGFYAYPQRTAFASVHKGFIGALDMLEPNKNTFCSSNKIGYKMFLNSPESIPQTSGNYIQLSPGQEVIISLIPQYVRSTADVRAYEPRKRQCYFNDERYLRLFRQYSRSNCMASSENGIGCDALKDVFVLYFLLCNSNMSTNFKVFFKERQFMAIKRTVLFSVTSLIANYGALCGLLMGISGLSLIELVYFVSLRLYHSLHQRRVSKKKLQRKLKSKLEKELTKKLLMQQILARPSFGWSSPAPHQQH